LSILQDPNNGFDPTITTWIEHLLTSRITEAVNPFTGDKIAVGHTRGVPQGSVLSPVLWNIFFNPLIAALAACTYRTVAYADDLCFVVSAEDTDSTASDAQELLDMLGSWAMEHDIMFCPQKSEVTFLHWNDEVDAPALTLDGQPLRIVTQVRYLGVLLEQDLNWMPHITARIKSGRATLLRYNSVQGKLYGSSINTLLWFFEHVIMPHVAHSSFLYHDLLHCPKVFRSLQSLARMAYLQVSPARIHTPIASFQMALGSMPPAYRLIFNNLRTWIRLNNYKTAPEKDAILPPHLKVLFDNFINTGLAGCNLDAMPKQPNSALINVTILEEWTHLQLPASDVQIYTDGSKSDKAMQWGTGAGYVFIQGPTVLHESWLTLCHTKTIFQAKVMAITIYSDSQSALKALSATSITSKMVLECLNTIWAVSNKHELRLEWVKAHNGNKGNEIADSLAKIEAKTPCPIQGPGPFHTVPPSFVRNQVYHYSLCLWTHNWIHQQKCRQSKVFFQKPDRKRGREVANLDRWDAGIFIRWTTGHAFLGYHNSLISPEIHDPRCRLCFKALETSSHLLLECQSLEDLRRTLLLTPATPPATTLSVADIMTLARPLAAVLEVTGELETN
jgi:hypothetical protein